MRVVGIVVAAISLAIAAFFGFVILASESGEVITIVDPALDVGRVSLAVLPFAALGVGRLETAGQTASGSNTGSDASFGFMELCGGICPDQLQAGETTTPLFAGYAPGSLSGVSPSLTIIAVPNDGASTVTVPLALVVPEPASSALIVSVLSALAFARRSWSALGVDIR